MPGFEPIDALALCAVTGGAEGDPPQSCTTTTLRGGFGPLSGEYKTQTCRTNEQQCAQDVRAAGGSATDVLKCYAPPTGSQSTEPSPPTS
jgi:hypothetical protein